jgi:xanthine/CO dehydrogenase XdhC/CoxF family maturation factor
MLYGHGRSTGRAPLNLNFGAKCRGMVNVTLRLFYPRERSTATVEVEDRGPRARLEVFRVEEISERDWNFRPSSPEHSSYTG